MEPKTLEIGQKIDFLWDRDAIDTGKVLRKNKKSGILSNYYDVQLGSRTYTIFYNTLRKRWEEKDFTRRD